MTVHQNHIPTCFCDIVSIGMMCKYLRPSFLYLSWPIHFFPDAKAYRNNFFVIFIQVKTIVMDCQVQNIYIIRLENQRETGKELFRTITFMFLTG